MSNDPGPTARTEALINLADKLASQPLPPPEEPRKWPAVAAGVLLIVVIVAGIATIVGRGGDGDDSAERVPETVEPETSGDDAIRTSESAPSTVASTEPGAADTTDAVRVAAAATTPATSAPDVPLATASAPAPTPTTTAAAAAAPATSTTTATTTTVAGATTTVSPVVTVASSPGIEAPVRWAEFSGGVVYLRGRVPDQATADEVRAKAAAVVGDGNVVVEYEIVAGTPRPPSAPLYVRDSVLFARGSSAITDSSRGVLDLGVALLSQNPQVTIDVQGHTDSDGTDADNLALSQERVDAIVDYFVSKDVDPNRLTRKAYGESRPIADNATAEGRALNRRVEFTINNLLG